MPKIESHLRLANRNQAALATLISADQTHNEWIATIAFYKAVQLAEALRVKKTGRASTDHKSRNEYIRVHHQTLYKHLRPLYQSSLIARYLGYVDSGAKTQVDCFADYMSGDVVGKLIQRRLIPFEDQLLQIESFEFDRARF